MKYNSINPSLFINNRKQFCNKLFPGSIAIFNANDIMPTNADGSMLLKQNSDLFYLSGVDQEDTILVLFPDHPENNLREVLFLRETNDEITTWEGHKLTKKEAQEITGINNIMWLNQFENTFFALMAEAEHVYLDTNEHIRRPTSEVESRNNRFIKYCLNKFPLHQYHRSAPIVYAQRAIKSSEEIKLLQEAIDITEKGFRRILPFVKPGIWEYEIEAELIHEFTRNRSRGFAYAPIIASGPNACILHYIENNSMCNAGDVLLLDVGAEYANYNADLTRSIPVNGKFSKRQKEVYKSVLHVQREAYSMLTPGNIIPEYQKEVSMIMESELLGLGLITKTDIKNQDKDRPAYKKYFMHGVSHHLGLDVHDVGSIYRKFSSGMVLTVEPGIYIREENLGIRLENNVVIKEKGVDDLMKNIPVEIDEIEEIMNSR